MDPRPGGSDAIVEEARAQILGLSGSVVREVAREAEGTGELAALRLLVRRGEAYEHREGLYRVVVRVGPRW